MAAPLTNQNLESLLVGAVRGPVRDEENQGLERLLREAVPPEAAPEPERIEPPVPAPPGTPPPATPVPPVPGLTPAQEPGAFGRAWRGAKRGAKEQSLAGMTAMLAGVYTPEERPEKIGWAEWLGEMAGAILPDLPAYVFGGGIGGIAAKTAAKRAIAGVLVKKGMGHLLAKEAVKEAVGRGGIGAATALLEGAVPRVARPLAQTVIPSATAFAVPGYARSAIGQELERPEAERRPIGDVLISPASRARALEDVLKEAVVGGVLGAAKVGAGAVTRTAARPVRVLAETGAEIGALATAPPILEGRAPGLEDVLGAAFMVTGLKGAGAVGRGLVRAGMPRAGEPLEAGMAGVPRAVFKKGVWQGNMTAPDSPFVTDGVALYVKDGMAPRDATKIGLPITPDRQLKGGVSARYNAENPVPDKMLAEHMARFSTWATLPIRRLPGESIVEPEGVKTPVNWFADPEGQIYAIASARVQHAESLLKPDQWLGSDPASPVVMVKGGKPVGLLAPVRYDETSIPPGVRDAATEMAKQRREAPVAAPPVAPEAGAAPVEPKALRPSSVLSDEAWEALARIEEMPQSERRGITRSNAEEKLGPEVYKEIQSHLIFGAGGELGAITAVARDAFFGKPPTDIPVRHVRNRQYVQMLADVTNKTWKPRYASGREQWVKVGGEQRVLIPVSIPAHRFTREASKGSYPLYRSIEDAKAGRPYSTEGKVLPKTEAALPKREGPAPTPEAGPLAEAKPAEAPRPPLPEPAGIEEPPPTARMPEPPVPSEAMPPERLPKRPAVPQVEAEPRVAEAEKGLPGERPPTGEAPPEPRETPEQVRENYETWMRTRDEAVGKASEYREKTEFAGEPEVTVEESPADFYDLSPEGRPDYITTGRGPIAKWASNLHGFAVKQGIPKDDHAGIALRISKNRTPHWSMLKPEERQELFALLKAASGGKEPPYPPKAKAEAYAEYPQMPKENVGRLPGIIRRTLGSLEASIKKLGDVGRRMVGYATRELSVRRRTIGHADRVASSRLVLRDWARKNKVPDELVDRQLFLAINEYPTPAARNIFDKPDLSFLDAEGRKKFNTVLRDFHRLRRYIETEASNSDIRVLFQDENGNWSLRDFRDAKVDNWFHWKLTPESLAELREMEVIPKDWRTRLKEEGVPEALINQMEMRRELGQTYSIFNAALMRGRSYSLPPEAYVQSFDKIFEVVKERMPADLSRAVAFGQQGTLLVNALKTVEHHGQNGGPDYEWLRRTFRDLYYEKGRTGDLSRAAQQAFATWALSSPLTAVKNVTLGLPHMTAHARMIDVVRAMPIFMREGFTALAEGIVMLHPKGSRQFQRAQIEGIVTQADEMALILAKIEAQGGGFLRKLGAIVVNLPHTLMVAGERAMRIAQAETVEPYAQWLGRMWAAADKPNTLQWWLNKGLGYHKPREWARYVLQDIWRFENWKDIAQRLAGGGTLTKAEASQAREWGAGTPLGITSVITLPPLMSRFPLWSVLWRYAARGTAVVYKSYLEQAVRHGNYGPLMKYMGTTLAGGAGLTLLYQFLRGKQEAKDKNALELAWIATRNAEGLQMLTNFFQSRGWLEALTPPILRSAAEQAYIVGDAIAGTRFASDAALDFARKMPAVQFVTGIYRRTTPRGKNRETRMLATQLAEEMSPAFKQGESVWERLFARPSAFGRGRMTPYLERVRDAFWSDFGEEGSPARQKWYERVSDAVADAFGKKAQMAVYGKTPVEIRGDFLKDITQTQRPIPIATKNMAAFLSRVPAHRREEFVAAHKTFQQRQTAFERLLGKGQTPASPLLVQKVRERLREQEKGEA